MIKMCIKKNKTTTL